MKVPPENYLIAHTDGGARGNPGPAGYGVVIHDARGGKVVFSESFQPTETAEVGRAERRFWLPALRHAHLRERRHRGERRARDGKQDLACYCSHVS